MKAKMILATLCLLFVTNGFGQTPKIYINLATHNEMQNESYDTNKGEYDTAVIMLNQILNHIKSIQGKWNFQTCSKFVLGALKWEQAYTNQNDILQKMYSSGYVEIDPRNKTEMPKYAYNISDVYHLLDSCGVKSTQTVGGFIHWPYTSEDWTQFRKAKLGAVYKKPWQANIIWGGGSFDHAHDANNYGVWKPKNGDSEQNFYTHDPAANLWLVGNGCAPVISDTTKNIQWIVNLMRDNVNKIKNGAWGNDQFYSLSLMINVRDFNLPGYFTKVKTVLDSMQTFVNEGYMEWATITQKLSKFQTWSQQTKISYAQLACESATASVDNLTVDKDYSIEIYPNPTEASVTLKTNKESCTYKLRDAQGKLINFGTLSKESNTLLDLTNYNNGVYLLEIDNKVHKLIKE